MESKLKSLKVVELKDILAKASVSAPAKANKQDLIARIIASAVALDVYKKQSITHAPSSTTAKTSPSQSDDLLAPPEDVDWNVDEGSASEPPPLPKPAPAQPASTKRESPAKPKDKLTSATTPAAPTETLASSPTEDAELEKRKQRAARFGVPLVEPSKSKPVTPVRQSSNRPGAAAVLRTPSTTARPAANIDDTEKLKARAARFGTGKPSVTNTATAAVVTGQKRSAPPVENVDADELERRKKRAERFGTKV